MKNLEDAIKKEIEKQSNVMQNAQAIADLLRNLDLGSKTPVLSQADPRPAKGDPDFLNKLKNLVPQVTIGSLIQGQDPIDMFNKVMENKR